MLRAMTWIEEFTGRNNEYWVARVQQLILEHTKMGEDGHGETDIAWMGKLLKEVERTLPTGEVYDGNMRMAALTSYILGLWYMNVQMAKSYDSHRPTGLRITAQNKLNAWKLAMMNNMVDASKLPTYFPGQPWDFPYSPDSESGEFV